MSGNEVALIAIAGLLFLIAIRIPIAISFFVVSFIGLFVLRGSRTAIYFVNSVPFEFISHWSLSAIPMFLLMGAIASRSGISESLFRAARLWLGFLPGGLAVATNWASAAFAAASGSSIATVAAMGRLAIPEMLRYGYKDSLATGVVACAGTLGALIPPSILFILYGVFAEESITRLLIAGVIPGLLTAFVYTALIITRCIINPELAPRQTERPSINERMGSLLPVTPVIVIILGIILALYGGIVTATEAGAFGAALTAITAYFSRRLSFRVMIDSVTDAVGTTANIFMIAMGAAMFASFLAVSGFPSWLGDQLISFNPSSLQLILIISVTYIILGMFLDPIGILLLTLPILIPLLEAQKIDMIWFGVLTVKFIEIGLLTPPVGLNVYTVKAVVGGKVPLSRIFAGVGWFLVAEVFIMALLIGFPALSTWLPAQMN
ncbi:MAG: TRAP transporter large permease [Marinosulfonomonas sp.]|nr:TRAP transporter large permease [Marinosulfonomonas sp.]